MKASISHKYGPPCLLKIKEIKKPIPQEYELLVKVHAATVNRTDCAMLRAKPFIMRFMTGLLKPNNSILGTDFAGVIEEVGNKVTRFNVGDSIFGFNDNGLSSHAEYLCINEDNFIGIIPKEISYSHAAASIEGFHYAQNFINKVQIKKNDKILVNGATGAIGSAMVQLLITKGVEVTATCNTENISIIKNINPTKIIDYTKEDFTQLNEQFNFVFDAVGKSSFVKCKSILAKNGVYISSELGFMAQNIWFAILTPIFNRKKVVFPFPNKHRESINLVSQLMINGKFKPLIDRTYSLDQISEAFTYAETGEKTGNLVIQFD